MAKVKVGVAWRRDGRNAAHQGDLDVFKHSGLQADVEVYSLSWHGAATVEGLNLGELKDMDLLIIPGGPHANQTQLPVLGAALDNAAKGKNSTAYADQRASSELDLIQQARTIGMPILALCGGSWRLVQNYGGQTVELAALDAKGRFLGHGARNANRSAHAGPMSKVETEFKHDMSIKPNSLVQDAMTRPSAQKGKPPIKPTSMKVNSVHWAAVRTGEMGARRDAKPRPYHLVPNDMLEVSAKDPSDLGTSEAVESRSGAPVLGVQWHPEYQLPTDQASEHEYSRQSNLALMQWMVKAGKAYRAHRDSMDELLKNSAVEAEDRPKETVISDVKFSGAPQHTGTTGAAMRARTIPRHPDDREGAKSLREHLVRTYLFHSGRKEGSLFLTSMELFNLATGAPLSRFHERRTMQKKVVLDYLARNEPAQKYVSREAMADVQTW